MRNIYSKASLKITEEKPQRSGQSYILISFPLTLAELLLVTLGRPEWLEENKKISKTKNVACLIIKNH